jgi:transcription antitermination factor NusG
VVETHWGQEARAASEIENQGFAAFLPVFTVMRQLRGEARPKPHHTPLFPRYLFTRFDCTLPGWPSIAYSRGVRRLISTPSGRPISVPAVEVERLMAEVGAGQQPAPVPDLDDLTAKIVLVEITGGITVQALCTMGEGDRLRVLMSWLGGEREVELPRSRVTVA